MKTGSVLLTTLFIGLFVVIEAGCVELRGDEIVLSGEGYAISFSASNGSIFSLTQKGKGKSVLRGGEHGLWQVRFQDKTEIKAADFGADSNERFFKYEIDEAANAIRMIFNGPEIGVNVTATGHEDSVDFSAQVTPKEKTVLDFFLPARLRFDPEQVERFVFPIGGNYSVGVAFNAAFFRPQDEPVGWDSRTVGSKGYVALYGDPLDEREYHDPPTTLKVTAEGSKWLGTELVKRVAGAKAVVNRPSTRKQADLVLVDSPNGPYFSACHLGGKGLIWRIGGTVSMLGKRLGKQDVTDMLMAVIGKLSASPPAGRNKLGIVAPPKYGPKYRWAGARDWLKTLRSCRAVTTGKVQQVELVGPRDMIGAMKVREFFAILNPYGEGIPVLEDGGIEAAVKPIGQYVRAGGNWFEISGYPFYYELHPKRYVSIERKYPNAFADFLHLDARTGSASLFGVQPQEWPPWEGAKNKKAIFVPRRLGCGGDEQGGYGESCFATYVKPDETWQSPTVRLGIGKSAVDGIQAYCEANQIKRKLKDKMSPELLEKFKRSVVLSYGGNCRDKIASLESLPVPTMLFFADYLKGGFDKEYPDHLPPRADFGTPEEFRAFIAKAHGLGHLVMPYVNPTWWCDHPRGPTFKREGEEPLLRKLDGELSYECYGKNDGYTVCHWHPAVQAANRQIVRQFTDEYPVTVLFQDQNAARAWRYDTNPASPTPYAYFDGLISQAAEDYTKGTPLSTEGGCDRLVNYESQFSGLSFDLVPLGYTRQGIRLMKYEYPPKTWEVFPVALYIAHDKTAMIHHFILRVSNEEILAWTMGIGFSLNYGSHATSAFAKDEWFKWLDRLQKSVCARYVGEPLRAFEHDRGSGPTPADDGVLRATYDKIKVTTNLGPVRLSESGRDLAPYGFYMTGPGLVAASLRSLGGMDFGDEGMAFVAEGNARKADVWVFAPQEREVAVELPLGMSGDVSIAVENGRAVTTTVRDRVVNFRLPLRPGRKRMTPPTALADKASCDWPGSRPAIGVLNISGMGAGTGVAWSKAFQDSPLCKEFGLSVRDITTVQELVVALKAGPGQWFTIINPYGEGFPITAPGKWREMIEAIRQYVNNGGCWWETSGYSLYSAYAPKGDGWQRELVGRGGMALLGIPVVWGDVKELPQLLRVPPEGGSWLGKDLGALVEKSASMVNRGLPRGARDPGHVTLVAGDNADFIGGYRLDGWGWFWRIGGFSPNPGVALPVAVAATEHVYTHPPVPVKPGGEKYLWHIGIRGQSE